MLGYIELDKLSESAALIGSLSDVGKFEHAENHHAINTLQRVLFINKKLVYADFTGYDCWQAAW